MVTVTIYAVNSLDPYLRYWIIYKNGAVVKQITAVSGYTWNLNLEPGTYEFGISCYVGTYSGTINGMTFTGLDYSNAVAFTVGAPPPSEAVLSVSPTTVEPRGSITFTVSGFVDGGDYVYLDYLSGPPEEGPYPRAAFRFPAAASGSYTTNAPPTEGTYVARARQGTLLSNTATFNVVSAPPPPSEAEGKVYAIHVVDKARNVTSSYINGVWNRQPKVTAGNNLYISACAKNIGAAGNLTLTIKDDTGAILSTATVTLGTGAGFCIGTDTINMPDRAYTINCSVHP